MKLVTFRNPEGRERAGWLQEAHVIDINLASNGQLPHTMIELLEQSEANLATLQQLASSTANTPINPHAVYQVSEVELLAPLPRPTSVRDFFAFEEHVKTGRKRNGLEVVAEWYEIPVFYFSNHMAVVGPNHDVARPRSCQWLDYELEIACVIGKQGRNISRHEAEDYIVGYCIMNDWSARDLQRKEMKVGLGPAKGKDFATTLGPYIVTKDELEPYRIADRGQGSLYNLEMTAKVNGELLSRGNFKDIHYTFAQMIERASDGVTLYPGDVIGSGTVGTGCILELGENVHRWLEPGDIVELSITELGETRNRIIAD
jgi:2-keto-4-pentenoate hydratase/2-oxohepta-3-ene-1,7-dioic acid hydratase in catechol pathway